VTVLNQRFANVLMRRFNNFVPRIAGEVGSYRPCDRPAGPRSPAALLASRLVHSSGIVLKMHPRIPEKNAFWRMGDEPSHGGVRHRPLLKGSFITAQVRSHRPVEAEYCASREPPLPKRMTIFQTRDIEFSPAILIAKCVQCPPIKFRPRCGQERTQWKQRHAAR